MIFKKIVLLISSISIFNVGLFDKSEKEKDDKFIESKEKLENHHEPSLFLEENKSKNEYSYNGTGLFIYKISENNKNIVNNVDKPVIIKDVSNIDFYDDEITV